MPLYYNPFSPPGHMTVAELKKILDKHPPSCRVLIANTEGGYDDIDPLACGPAHVWLNDNVLTFSGRHKLKEQAPDRAKDFTTCLLLRPP